jgi:hypothetical protein
MERRNRLAAALAFVVLVVGTTSASAANWGESLFSERTHDFGTVARGSVVRHPFVLTNRLAEPVTIVNIRASCGCTSGSANASVVPPGGSAIVEAQMDTRNFVGPKATVLFVLLATPSGGEVEVGIPVQSLILSDVVLNPGTIDFGTLTRGQKVSRELTIDRINLDGWKINKMVSASKVLDANLVETVRQGATVGYKLTVSLKADAPTGVIRDEIRLLSNDPATASIPIPVSGVIRGDLNASPSQLNLGNVVSAGGVQARFFVRGSKPFSIVKIDGAGDGFELSPPDKGAKAAHVVTVTFKPEASPARGEIKRVFRVTTDVAGEAPVEVNATLHLAP